MDPYNYKERTLFVSNVDEQVTEELLYELFLQAGPLCKVVIPNTLPGMQRLRAFVTFKHVESTPYALALFSGIMLYGTPLKLQFYRGSKFESQRRRILRNKSDTLGNVALSSSDPARLPRTAPARGPAPRTTQFPGAAPPAVVASPPAVQQSQVVAKRRHIYEEGKMPPPHPSIHCQKPLNLLRGGGEPDPIPADIRCKVAPSQLADTRHLIMSCLNLLRGAQETGQVDAERAAPHHSRSAVERGSGDRPLRDKQARSHSSGGGSGNNGRSAEDRNEQGRRTGPENGGKRCQRDQRGTNDNHRPADRRHEVEKPSKRFRRSSESTVVRDGNVRFGVSRKEDDRSWSSSRAGRHRSLISSNGYSRQEGNHYRGSDLKHRLGKLDKDYSPRLDSKYRMGRSERGYSPSADSRNRLGRTEQRYSPRPEFEYRLGISGRRCSPSLYSKNRLGRSETRYSPSPDPQSRLGRTQQRYSPSTDSEYRLGRSEQRYSPSPDPQSRLGRSEQRYSPSPNSKYRLGRSERGLSPSPDPKYLLGRTLHCYSPSPDSKYHFGISDPDDCQRPNSKYCRSPDEKYLHGRSEGVYSQHPDARHRVGKVDEAFSRSTKDTFERKNLAVELRSTHPDASLRRDISRQVYFENTEDAWEAPLGTRDTSRSPPCTRELRAHTYSIHSEDSYKINIVSHNSSSGGDREVIIEPSVAAMSNGRDHDGRAQRRKRTESAVFDHEDGYGNRRKIDWEGQARYHPDAVENRPQESCRQRLNAARRRDCRYIMK